MSGKEEQEFQTLGGSAYEEFLRRMEKIRSEAEREEAESPGLTFEQKSEAMRQKLTALGKKETKGRQA